ncbi:hypothetical protein KCP70_10975 [Salmonella enterica subsp. enterica]|nr:hypothetical protein KCP70_10975 [Salmonella enterica subsp. enterica]
MPSLPPSPRRSGARRPDAGTVPVWPMIVDAACGHNVDYGAPVTSAIRLAAGDAAEVRVEQSGARWQLKA